ncbi:MAG TPA: hypothetical protein VFT72_04630 [Opitutaceae bacterium]|nr:hypothetical protein [Opitutaceae bacterium]
MFVRACASSFFTVIGIVAISLFHAASASAAPLELTHSTSEADGETVITVPGSEGSDWQFQWFIDGVAQTSTPVSHTGQLVIYLDKVSPGRTFKVDVYKNAVATSSEPLNLGNTTDTSSAGGSSGSDLGKGDEPSPSGSDSSPAPQDDTTSDPEEPVTGAPISSGSALINLSTRAYITPGDTLIAGLIIAGTEPKPVLIRAIGPTLKNYGVSDALENPTLTLYKGSDILKQNDDWGSSGSSAVSQASQVVQCFPLANGGRDAALYVVLPPGAYTAHLNSGGAGSGTALMEFYDVNPSAAATSRLSNISTLGTVGSGDHVMIVGFIVEGDRPKTILVRALGPALASYGVTGFMADPKITVFSGDSAIASNDNWTEPSTGENAVAAVTAQINAVPLPSAGLDSALCLTLAPGAYTAVVTAGATGKSDGRALVEVYEVP